MAGVRESFRSFKTLDISFRTGQLESLGRMLKEKEQAILDAVYKDLHKARRFTTPYQLESVKLAFFIKGQGRGVTDRDWSG